MIHQTLYCTYQALEMIDTFQVEYPSLYKLCVSHSDVMLDIPDRDFSEELKVNPFLKFLFKREHGSVDTTPEFFEDILDHDLQNNSRDFFLVSCEEVLCEEAREKFGVAVFNENELGKLDKLSLSAKWILPGSQTYTCQSADSTLAEGWAAVVNGYTIKPLNSIIIVDNYLYHSDKECCHENIMSLLKGIVPQKLGVDLQILLVIWDDGGGKFTKQALLAITLKLEALLSSYPYKVKVGLMTHNRKDTFHQRAIITNYHFLETQHGYHAFKHKHTTRFSNDLKINWAYASVTNEVGDTEVAWIEQNLKEIRKQRSTNLSLPQTRSYNYLIGDCFPNRLLD